MLRFVYSFSIYPIEDGDEIGAKSGLRISPSKIYPRIIGLSNMGPCPRKIIARTGSGQNMLFSDSFSSVANKKGRLNIHLGEDGTVCRVDYK